jgi:hypothetical protein
LRESGGAGGDAPARGTDPLCSQIDRRDLGAAARHKTLNRQLLGRSSHGVNEE